MSNHRFADPDANHIDYCLNILGVRVWRDVCQLIAKSDGQWTFIGPKWDLPIEIPTDEQSLKDAGTDTLRLTAWQYERGNRPCCHCPGSALGASFRQCEAKVCAFPPRSIPSRCDSRAVQRSLCTQQA
jgi:hypothetical protein